MHIIQKSIKIISEEGLNSLVIKMRLKMNRRWQAFNRMAELSEWTKAAETGEVLLKKYSQDVDLNKKMALCYSRLGNDNLSAVYMKAALELKLKSGFENITKLIQEAIEPSAAVTSRYEYVGGDNNMGMFEHEVNTADSKNVSRYYITKIISNKDLFVKESKFYLKICSLCPILKEISPRLVNITEARGLYFITMEKIIGREPDESSFNTIIGVSNLIGSIKYTDIIGLLPEHDVSLPRKYARNFIEFNYLFANIHKESSNIEIFRWLSEIINALSCSENIGKLVNRLKGVILDSGLHKYINPVDNYVFLHNDFHIGNIFMEDQSSRCCVIDWEKYNVGPKGLDLVRFFRDFNPSFQEINDLYLSEIDTLDAEDPKERINVIIHKAFFVYPLIISYFVNSDADKLEKLTESHIQPAVEYSEKLVACLPKHFLSE